MVTGLSCSFVSSSMKASNSGETSRLWDEGFPLAASNEPVMGTEEASLFNFASRSGYEPSSLDGTPTTILYSLRTARCRSVGRDGGELSGVLRRTIRSHCCFVRGVASRLVGWTTMCLGREETITLIPDCWILRAKAFGSVPGERARRWSVNAGMVTILKIEQRMEEDGAIAREKAAVDRYTSTEVRDDKRGNNAEVNWPGPIYNNNNNNNNNNMSSGEYLLHNILYYHL